MSLQTYPPVSGTINVIHSGDPTGASFTAMFTSADGNPTIPQSYYTWDLTGTDAENLFPSVTIIYTPTNEVIMAHVEVTADQISVAFVWPLDPNELRIKAVA